MSDPFRNKSLIMKIKENSAIITASHNKVDFFLDILHPIEFIQFDTLFQICKAFRGIVEIRNRFVETSARNIDQFALEFSESTGCFKSLLFCFKNVISTAVFNENITAPEVSIRILIAVFAIESSDDTQCSAAAAALSKILRGQMSCDPFHIVHKGRGILENIMIDPLNGVVNDCTTLIKSNLVGIVDMTGSKRNSDDKITVNGKMRTDVSQIVLHKITSGEKFFGVGAFPDQFLQTDLNKRLVFGVGDSEPSGFRNKNLCRAASGFDQ